MIDQIMAKRILVVDDDKQLNALIQTVLRHEGYKVSASYSALEGLESLAQEKIDLALLDVRMPGMDGLEMLSRLRKHHKDLPVIVMTALSTAETAISALREHACDFLAKPFKVEELLSAVQAALTLRPQESVIQVLSARPEWIELRVPCDLAAVEPLEHFMVQLKADLPPATRENVTLAFREMLRNAIEHGGKNDPRQYVEIGYLRSQRIILYRIKDPGDGFDPRSLSHAAILNLEGDPTRHQKVRDRLGMRPGGLGILIARDMVDEMIYNERHNEVILIKYLDASVDKEHKG